MAVFAVEQQLNLLSAYGGWQWRHLNTRYWAELVSVIRHAANPETQYYNNQEAIDWIVESAVKGFHLARLAQKEAATR